MTQAYETTKTPPRTLDLDALSAMNVDELGELYANGTMPSSLRVLEGHPRGRMLAIRGLDDGRVGSLLRSFSSALVFPWGGKSFSGGPERGTGINRVHLGGRHQLFPFHTMIKPSVIDDKPCIMLEYNLEDNPGLIRKIHDEVREIEPGLFLGPAMWKREGQKPVFVLWFALDTRVQSLPIGRS